MIGSAAGNKKRVLRGGKARAAALLMAAALTAGVLVAVLAGPARAASFTVTNTADSGAGSLRQAITDANGNAGADTITFDSSLSGRTITLTSELQITDPAGLTIDGESTDITVSGNNVVRVFWVRVGAKLTLSNLTVEDGNAFTGGGIANQGDLTVIDSTLSGNNATHGGGIHNSGSDTLTVSGSTFSANSARSVGGGIANDNGTVTVNNSTFSNNSASEGGAMFNIREHLEGGTLEVSNSTLSGNRASQRGGGIYSSGTTTLENTIVSDSPSGGNCSGSITDGGYNLSSDDSCSFAAANNSLSNTDPLLGDLADNGGPTMTHALPEGSPALDKGNSFGTTTDQRGQGRPSDFDDVPNATGGDGSDIGAFEVQQATPPDERACTIKGTGGKDVLRGTARRDVICAYGGNDTIKGGGGDDRVMGGSGRDTMAGGGGDDRLYGGPSGDELDARDGSGGDLADGGRGDDTCSADRGDTKRNCS